MAAEQLTALTITSIAAGTDLCDGRIGNWLTVTGCLAAAVLAVLRMDATAFADRLFGFILPVLLLGWLFAIGGIGGGDIKLFCVIGGLLGYRALLKCMVLSVLFGAGLAVSSSFQRCRTGGRLRHLRQYVRRCLYSRSLQIYEPLPASNAVIHFSVPVLLGLWVCMGG